MQLQFKKASRKFLGLLLLGLGFAGSALGQAAWPERPIKLVVGSTPGGAADFVSRAFGEHLARELGQAVVIDNKPGAASSLGVEFVAKSPPDGYTITVASSAAISVNPALAPHLWGATQTLMPVARVAGSPLVITVSPKIGVKTVRELIDYAKKNPGKTNFGHAGAGSIPHLGGVLFNQLAGTDIVSIPFKGGGPAVQSLIAGDTQVTFGTPPSVLQFIKSGRLVGLAVTTPERFSLAPDLPSMKEAGLPNYKLDLWYGLFAPPGTPPEVLKKMLDAAHAVLQKPEYKAALASGGMEAAQPAARADFVGFVAEENKFWAKLTKDAGAKWE